MRVNLSCDGRPLVCCPSCRGPVSLQIDDAVRCSNCGDVGAVRDCVVDFVQRGDYADNFGYEWSRFQHTQLDSYNGTTISRDRFWEVTGWSRADLRGQTVLDAGCGAGRYSEVALESVGRLVALDLSTAAYVTRRSLPDPRLTVVRGDLLEPPLCEASFDKVFSIGVLQHTPSPSRAAQQLLRLVRPQGRLAIWMYERRWYTPFLPKGLLRGGTTRLPPKLVISVSEGMVRLFTPVARATGRLPHPLARLVRTGLPIASYWGVLPLTPDQHKEWSLLDTYDWLSPRYDRPQTYSELRRALLFAGASAVDRIAAPGLAVVATRGDR